VHPARPREGDLLAFDQFAEQRFWAVLRPPAVDVNTIIARCLGATIRRHADLLDEHLGGRLHRRP
jgi:hypothetical protein